MVPEEIVTTWEERQLYDGCHEPEKHVDGSEVYTIEYVGDDGKIYGRPPRRLFKAELLKAFMVKHGIRPRTKWGRQLKSIIPAAEKYEAALEAAIRISGIEDAKNATH
jgi:hypothetical protein